MKKALDFQRAAAAFHFDGAWELHHLLDAADVRERFRRDWLLALGWFYQSLIFTTDPEAGFRESRRYFDEAVARFSADPEILVAAGSLYEWSGSLRQGDPAHLKQAESLYEQALRAEPGLAEALLRYGLVLLKRERLEPAVEPLRRVLALGAEDYLIYRARMGLGRLAETAGRFPLAGEHYRAATRIRPSWQVAYLALSHCLHASGARAESREVLDSALRIPEEDENLFGWWSYELGLSERLDPLFERMRREVLLQGARKHHRHPALGFAPPARRRPQRACERRTGRERRESARWMNGPTKS